MSNTTDNIFSREASLKGSCRIAYIIDNRQPVRCSIISDQPLFFMDFGGEADFAEDEGEIFDFTDIEQGVAALQERITGLGRFGEELREDTAEERFAMFLEDAAAITRPFAEQGRRPAAIKFIENTLRQSRLAAALLDFAAGYGTGLRYDPQVAGALYDRKGGQIHVNPHICREDQILMTARELRRVWQHRNGALLNPLTFHPDQAVLVNRAQIADLNVVMVRIAWELQLAGEKEVWERVETSSMADLARAFARESYLDFRTLNNGVAQSAVFESWFLSERCRNEDKKLIQLMLADYQGYVFDTEQSSQHITAELIIALGSMPFGKNYLAPYVNTIMTDAIFTEVRDRSNANFLWFIKFERSFRETEQELQTGRDISGRVDLHGHPDNNKNIRFGDHEKEAKVIALPRAGQKSAASSEAGNGEDSANIIQFRQRSGEA